ncbi:MAG TPA: trehalose-phosphatase [Trebonia sp.]|jgi:trehalose 6-phosphate phosphatase
MSSRPTALEALAENPSSSALVLDFDGVLSPIVDDPTTSALPEDVATSLRGLARSLGLLAVISGRPVRFLEDRIRVPGMPLLGSYGMEQSWDGERQIDPEAKNWLSQVAAAGRQLNAQLAEDQGIRVEEKSVSVAVHWRQAPDHAVAARRVREVTARVAAETGLRLEPGKLVEELRPPIAMDKGSAIARLMSARENLTLFAYAGDDLGDIPALRAVREAGGYALVVDHGPETDPRMLDLADETYPGTEAFAAWLARLAGAIGG